MIRYQLWPLVVENGVCNVPDEILIAVWRKMAIEGKAQKVFYDGHVFNDESWLAFMKSPNNLPVFVMDTVRVKMVFLAWLNNIEDTHALAHFCPLWRFRREAIQMVLDFWKSFKGQDGKPLFDIILGTTPETNPEAVAFVKRFGFQEIGTIPKLCNDIYNSVKCGGVITCLEL
jgi:hypothetical protein